MSRKERDRLAMMRQVKEKKIRVSQAAQMLGLSYRQAKRVWRRYRAQGDAGLVHRLRGRPGSRRKSAAVKEKVLKRYEQRYADFGPTLAAEYLRKEDKLEVDHETLRRWLLDKGLWQVQRRRQRHRQWRERKICVGQMVQLDGSHHDWFEGRRAKASLMVMVDDATNETYARFFEEETTEACFQTFAGWARRYGVPRSLYVDRDSIYRCEREATVAEQLDGSGPQTQFGRAMRQLGVDLILANSPQAKGRVERRNGLLQDRLVKALRLCGIADLEAANDYLDKEFLRELNGKFTVAAASSMDVHQPAPGNLQEILSWEEQRVVQRDWTVAWDNGWYQIDQGHEGLSLAGRKVLVRRMLDGTEQILYRGQKLRWNKLPERPQRVAVPRPRPIAGTKKLPAVEHPWRKSAARVTGKEFWREVKRRGRIERQARPAGLRSASATLRPPSVPQGAASNTTNQKGDILS